MSSRRLGLLLIACGSLVFATGPGRADAQPPAPQETARCIWTVADLFASPTPYALGHRGYGANLTDPTRPIEDTVDAFRHGFTDGIRVVEMDLQRTADGKIIVLHDPAFADYTCVSSLTYDEILVRAPQVPLFRTVLNSMRHFDRSDELSGILFAEILVPIPLCDDANTTEAANASESALVAAVLAEIRQARMEKQVVLNSESPSILAQVQKQAPEIARALTLNALQLLNPDDIPGYTGYPVTLIPKNDFGLKWYNVDGVARLPTYYPDGLPTFVGTTLAIPASGVSLDKLFLFGAGAQAPGVVQLLHGAGLEVVAWTSETQEDWDVLAGIGVDGITTNDIPYALDHQAPFTGTCLATVNGVGLTAGLVSPGVATESVPLALAPMRTHPFVDGQVHVVFTLRNAAPARVEVYDVRGRSVDAREVGVLGEGRHELALGRDLAPGVYLVRLSMGAEHEMLKAIVAN